MRLLFTFLAISIAIQLFAQQNIFEARNFNQGDKATVSGIVTNGDELGPIRYLQDSSAGLAIYDTKLSNVKRGDSITVSGEVNPYNNLFEITKVTSFTVHSSGNQLPGAKIITIGEIGENYEGQLVQINNIEIVNASGTFAGNKNYSFSDGQNTGEFRINTSSPIVGQGIPTGKISLIAICSQYSFSPNDTQTGYQLLPRDLDDFISGKSINFTAPVLVENISQNEFTLTWKTDVNASTEIRFGTEANLSNFVVGTSSPENNEFLHEAKITGLLPAEIIYAQAFSVNESDTAFSPIGVFVTESNSSGEIKAYFNTNVNTTYSTGTNAMNIGNTLEDTLIAYLNRATESIDFCIYNINNSGLSNVSQALNNAHNRGIKVRIISDGTTVHAGTDDLISAVPYLEGPEENQRDGIMHNKFAVIDAYSANPNIPVVWSGSTNITYDQIQTDANNIIFIQDQSLAKAYTLEFEEMWGNNGTQPNEAKSKFGSEKLNNTPHEFLIGGNRVQCYFSPSDGTNQKIIEAINSADNDLNIETMLITRSDIAGAISDAALRGVNTHVITNALGGNSSTVNSILNDALSDGKFIQDQTGKGTLHNKLAIVDANNVESDPQVITGSHNWSNSANNTNDENTLIIHNANIANQYFQQFAFRFTENGGNLVVSSEIIETNNVKIYPNPTVSQIHIFSPTPINKVLLYSISGEKIMETNAKNTNNVEIEMQNKLAGIYLLKVELSNQKLNTYKVIKKNK